MAACSTTIPIIGAKLTGTEIVGLVRKEIENDFPPCKVTDLIRLAVYEIFCQHSNFMMTRFTLKRLKELSDCHIQERLQQDALLHEMDLADIQSRVRKIFDTVFEKHQISHLNKADMERLLNLYHGFVDKNIDHFELSEVEDSNAFADFYQDLDVTLPLEEMEAQLKEFGCFQLRPIEETAHILIIGCGNGRFSCSGSSPNYMGFKPDRDINFYCPSTKTDQESAEYYQDYSLKHNHPREKYVTIDPALGSNPTIVAKFGTQPITELFKGKRFAQILFEGIILDGPYVQKDTLALLKDGGTILLYNGIDYSDMTSRYLSPVFE